MIAQWRRGEALKKYVANSKAHFIRLRQDLHLDFASILDESICVRPVDERIYYPAYNSLLTAMFPCSLGFEVSAEAMPTGLPKQESRDMPVGVFYRVRQQKIPMAFVEIKLRAHALSAETRQKADAQVRQRFNQIISYLREQVADTMCPPRIFAISALGLQVRFYAATVGKSGEPIIIEPPPGPPINKYLFDPHEYDHWKLSIMDSLCVSTLKSIRSDVLRYSNAIRAPTVPTAKMEKLMALPKMQELKAQHEARMMAIEIDAARNKSISLRNELIPGTSRFASPVTSASGEGSAFVRVGAHFQPAPNHRREDDVFAGKYLAQDEFEKLGLSPPAKGYIEGMRVDLYTLLEDLPEEHDDDREDTKGLFSEDGEERAVSDQVPC
ncbi:hypothetical protein L227DRAFT_36261 [Lentinus tigrinus ALCF2SS1-6]|uniref:Uncharacterized protein n=2 Tax=Lentinus tigrinus TaxID=5365 RepID=A0A5C2SGY3_9APHY|nr:hypothetical protein L227DRAFT_36261 [Lentinus tigrinus ALCF2SS1-6]